MCGIIGVLSNEKMIGWEKRKHFLVQSLYAGALRGWDSTGILAGGGNTLSHYKRALPSSDFLTLKVTQRILNNTDKYPFIIGHNRAATRGGIHDATSHPFNFENVIGVHNGTISNHRSLPEGNSFIVDSEAIFNAINKEGPEEIIPKLDGAFALVWLNKKDKKLHMIRNDDRPLHVAYIRGKETVLIASEGLMLRWLAGRNGFDIERLESLRSGELYTFSPDKLTKPKRKKIKLYEKKVYTNTNTNWSRYPNGGNTALRGTKTENSILTPINKKVGDKLYFVVNNFERYNGNHANGLLKGYIDFSPWITVQAHAQPYKLFQGISGTWLCEGTITAAYNSNGYNDVISVNNITITNKRYKVKDVTRISKNKSLKPVNINTKKFYGKRGEEITRREWNTLIQDGCINCSANIEDSETGEIGFTQTGDVMCKQCVEDFNQQEFVPRKCH